MRSEGGFHCLAVLGTPGAFAFTQTGEEVGRVKGERVSGTWAR